MSRQIDFHSVPGNSVQCPIYVLDEPGAGGACHEYSICTVDGEAHPVACRVSFQNGPVREHGQNGITNEALLAVVIDRMHGFQAGDFACRENEKALTHMQEALHWLQQRTLDRVRRGVEGENKE